MKKLKLNLQQLGNAEVLTRAQLKTILGGESGSGGPCSTNGCSRICFSSSYGGGVYGYGNCNQQGPAGHPSICDNYCCESGQPPYWC